MPSAIEGFYKINHIEANIKNRSRMPFPVKLYWHKPKVTIFICHVKLP